MDIPLYEFALRDDSLPRIQKDVLRYIIFRCGADGTCYFSQSTICRQLKYCRQQISEAVSWLREHSYIETRTKGRILTYDLSPYMTRRRNLSPNVTSPVVPADITCRPGRHRTSIELANEHNAELFKLIQDYNSGKTHTDETGRAYKISPSTRQRVYVQRRRA